jgi:hypothetical protein
MLTPRLVDLLFAGVSYFLSAPAFDTPQSLASLLLAPAQFIFGHVLLYCARTPSPAVRFPVAAGCATTASHRGLIPVCPIGRLRSHASISTVSNRSRLPSRWTASVGKPWYFATDRSTGFLRHTCWRAALMSSWVFSVAFSPLRLMFTLAEKPPALSR